MFNVSGNAIRKWCKKLKIDYKFLSPFSFKNMEETMKCVKTKSGEVKRVTDEQAHKMVSNDDAVYTVKSEWKEAVRPKVLGVKDIAEAIGATVVKKKKK
jgi:hypothetical protein